MLRVSRYCFVLAVAAGLLLAQPLFAAETTTGNLVTVQWLEQHRNDAGLLILDASPAPMYAKQHVPGAISIDVFSYGAQEIPGPEMEKRFQSWGVSPGKTIVVYDQGGTFLATRLFFTLHYHGYPVKNLSVLDGGMAKWLAEGLPVTDVVPAPAKGSFRISKINDQLRVRLPEVLTASGDPANNALVDALGPDWHFGQVAPFGRPGHIPNSVLLPGADFFNADKTFKSAAELRNMADHVNIRPEQQVYTYCGGGIAASVPFFALKYILDYPKVALFIESELGWMKDERELPFWTYDAPFLMREATWLQAWGGKMLRMYGMSNVSVVDVRPGAQFSEGHVPFSVNIPADTFRTHLGQPDKLVELLGPAGVDPSHEAIIVSGAGLTKESALAFVVLEKLGQKKVSILTGSMDQWTKLGFVSKDATGAGPTKQTAYAPNRRQGVLIADAKATRGIYPKVFIASGATVPTGLQDEAVVHVPYSDLLNPDGTPKAAKDIWNVLTKAGVPRYAELVCVSEDPGESAANYVILKLMGYPDIKVLVI
jgi:3-mercaptopyruvate sulfurtransferase SseA